MVNSAVAGMKFKCPDEFRLVERRANDEIAVQVASFRREGVGFRHFHDQILSYEVKLMKPDPGIFRLAIERAGCLPEECFYTDDIPAYTAAARQQGIDAVTFESAAQIERELKARGIEW